MPGTSLYVQCLYLCLSSADTWITDVNPSQYQEKCEREKNDQAWSSLIFFFIPVNYFFATCPDNICDCPPARYVTGRLRQREEKQNLERKKNLLEIIQTGAVFFQPRFRISHQSTYFSFLFFYSSASSIRSNRSVTQHLQTLLSSSKRFYGFHCCLHIPCGEYSGRIKT